MAEKDGGGQTSTRMTQDGQYRLLVEAITDYAIYMLDPSGVVKSWNPGAQRFKGYQAAEILGKHFSTFYTLEDRAKGEPERAMGTATREGRFESEGWRVRKDGSRFWAHVVLDPIRGSDGQIVGFAKITRDITQQKETQRALDQARLALFQSQKMDAIGQLTGGIAHDFNNLLTAILSSLDLARSRLPNDAKLMALIDNAVQAARRGTSLTRRMLTFARNHELNSESIEVSSLVQGMTDLLQSSVGPSVLIETRFPLASSTIRTDSNQLELALLNLVLNSRDAMPQGGVVTLSAREERVASGHADIESRSLCLPRGGRQWRGHGRRDFAASERTFLHDEGIEQGHWPWTIDDPWLRDAIGRTAAPEKQQGQRDHRRAVVSDGKP